MELISFPVALTFDPLLALLASVIGSNEAEAVFTTEINGGWARGSGTSTAMAIGQGPQRPPTGRSVSKRGNKQHLKIFRITWLLFTREQHVNENEKTAQTPIWDEILEQM